MKKYFYATAYFNSKSNDDKDPDLEDCLREYSEEGWRLHTVFIESRFWGDNVCIFEKEYDEDELKKEMLGNLIDVLCKELNVDKKTILSNLNKYQQGVDDSKVKSLINNPRLKNKFYEYKDVAFFRPFYYKEDIVEEEPKVVIDEMCKILKVDKEELLVLLIKAEKTNEGKE